MEIAKLLDEKEIYVADIYSDVHIFRTKIRNKSSESLFTTLKFLKDFKESKK